MDIKNTLFHIPMMYLQKIGIISAHNLQKKTFLLICLLEIFYIIYNVHLTIQLTTMPNNAFNIVDNAEEYGAYTQIAVKLIIMVYYRKNIYHLVTLTKYFWKHDSADIKRMIAYITTLQKIITVLFPLCGIATTVIAIISKSRSLPLGNWQIQNQPELHLVIFMSMVISLPLGIIIDASCDALYLGFCFEIAIQFKILCARVEELSVEEINTNDDLIAYFKELKYLIQYHSFLLRYLKEIKTIYSGIMMGQFLTIVPLIFSELYAFTESVSVVMLIRYGLGVISLLIQLSLYCFSADFVSHQVSQVPNAIYNSNWYSKHYKILKVPIKLFIQAGQEDIEFSACGLVKIDSNALIQVLRIVMSTMTILRNMKN